MHYYDDVSNLNAPYDTMPSGWDVGVPDMERMMRTETAPSPISGLGAMAKGIVPFPTMPTTGGGMAKGIVPPKYDSGATSGGIPTESLKMFQSQINGLLKSYGCQGIGVDGKLGPVTCGAAQHLAVTKKDGAGIGIWSVLSGPCTGKGNAYKCSPAPSGGGLPPVVSTEPPAELETSSGDFFGENKWLILGIGVATVAVGYAVAKKRRWIK